MNNRKKVRLQDIVEKFSNFECEKSYNEEDRFHEIISTQKIVDTVTNTVYHGIVDSDVIKIMNDLHKENLELRRELLGLKYPRPPRYGHYEVDAWWNTNRYIDEVNNDK